MADALANLAFSAPYPCHIELNVMEHSSIFRKACLIIEIRTTDSWMTPLTSYLKDKTLPTDKKIATKIKARAARYTLINETLYRRSFLSPYQRCVPPKATKHILRHTHESICRTHIGGWSLCHMIMTYGFYWPIMKQES